MNKQYTFSLPEEVGQVIDALPKTEKSKFVADAVKNQVRMKAKQKALNIIDLLNPKDWETDKDAVQLVQEARTDRSEQILANQKVK